MRLPPSQYGSITGAEPYEPEVSNVGFIGAVPRTLKESWMGSAYYDLVAKSSRTGQKADVSTLAGQEALSRTFPASYAAKRTGAVDLTGLREDEVRWLINEGYEDAGEMRMAVLQQRASEKRQRELATANDLNLMMGSLVAYAPESVLEWSLGFGMAKAAVGLRMPGRAARAAALPPSRGVQFASEVGATAAVSYAGEAAGAYLDPVDGVEEAIVNGTMGALMGATVAGGMHFPMGVATASSAAARKAAQSPTFQDAVMRAANYADSALVGQTTFDLDKHVASSPLDSEDLANRVLPSELGHKMGGKFATKARELLHTWKEQDPWGVGDRFVTPAAEGRKDGNQFMIVPAERAPFFETTPGDTRKWGEQGIADYSDMPPPDAEMDLGPPPNLGTPPSPMLDPTMRPWEDPDVDMPPQQPIPPLAAAAPEPTPAPTARQTYEPGDYVIVQRDGYGADWRVLEGSGTHEAMLARLQEQHVFARSTASFVDVSTIKYNQLKLLDMQELMLDNARMPGERRAIAEATIERQLAEMDTEIQHLKELRNGELDPDIKKKLTKQIEEKAARLEQQQARYQTYVRTDNPRMGFLGGRGVAAYMEKFFTNGQFPYWRLVNDERLKDTRTGEAFAQLAERLAGTNGAMRGDPNRPAFQSVLGLMETEGRLAFMEYWRAVHDAYGEAIGMGTGMTPAGAWRLDARQRAVNFGNKWMHKAQVAAGGKLGTVEGAEAPQVRLTMASFEEKVRDRMIDMAHAREGGPPVEPDPNPGLEAAIQKAADASHLAQRKAANLVKAAGGFQNQVQRQQLIDATKARLKLMAGQMGVALDPDQAALANRLRPAGMDLDDFEQIEDGLETLVAAWNDIFGMDTVLLTSRNVSGVANAAEMRDFLDRNTTGAAGWTLDGRPVIIVSPTKSADQLRQAIKTVTHEYGHAFWLRTINSLTDDQFRELTALHQDYLRELGQLEGGGMDMAAATPADLAKLRTMMGGRFSGTDYAAEGGGPRRVPEGALEWMKKFLEWLAEQASGALQLDPASRKVLDERHNRLFVGLARQMDRWAKESVDLTGMLRGPTDAVTDWMTAVRLGDAGVTSALEKQRGWIDFKEERILAADPAKRAQLEEKLAALQRQQDQSKAGEFEGDHFHLQYDKGVIGERQEDFKRLLLSWLDGDEDKAKRVLNHILHATPFEDGDFNNRMNLPDQDYDMQDRANTRFNAAALRMPSWYEVDGIRARDFIRNDQVEIMKEYIQKAHGVSEMQRVFGSYNGEEALTDAWRLGKAEGVDDATLEDMKLAFRQLRDTVIGRDEIIDDPSSLSLRFMRTARHVSISGMMGKVPQMQLVDLAVLQHISGFRNLLSAMEFNMRDAVKAGRMSVSKEMADLYGLVTEAAVQQRAAQYQNQMSTSLTYRTPVERFFAGTAKNIFMISGSHWFTDKMRTWGGILLVHEILEMAQKTADGGRLDAKDLNRLRSVNLDEPTLNRIREEWHQWVPEDQRSFTGVMTTAAKGRLYLGSTDLWKDQELRLKLVQAVRREMDSIVLTPNAATRARAFTEGVAMPGAVDPKTDRMLSAEAVKMLLLYKGFSLHAAQTLNVRVAQRGMRDKDMMLAMAAMVGMTYLVTQVLRTPDYIETDFEDALYESVIKSGILGLPGMGLEVIGDAGNTNFGLELAGVERKPYADEFGVKSVASALGGPVVSQALDIAYAPFQDKPKTKKKNEAVESMIRAGRYVVPYNNVWYNLLSNGIVRELNQALGGGG